MLAIARRVLSARVGDPRPGNRPIFVPFTSEASCPLIPSAYIRVICGLASRAKRAAPYSPPRPSMPSAVPLRAKRAAPYSPPRPSVPSAVPLTSEASCPVQSSASLRALRGPPHERSEQMAPIQSLTIQTFNLQSPSTHTPAPCPPRTLAAPVAPEFRGVRPPPGS